MVAFTLSPVVALSPVAGAHVYVTAPEAVNVVVPLPQRLLGEALAITVGKEFTVTVPVATVELVQLSCTETLYVVVLEGETIIDAVISPPGDHKYEYGKPPPAGATVNVALCPAQTVVEFTDADSGIPTLTVAVAVAEH